MTRTPIKALVVRTPYAQQIAAGSKPIEYRSRRTHYRGWVAIVAARRRESGTDAGRVMCLVRLADCVEVGPKDFNWHLADPHPLAERIELPGQLGLFDVTDQLPASVFDVVGSAAAPMPTLPVRPARKPRARRSPVGTMHVTGPSHLIY